MPHGDKERLQARFIACLLTEPTVYQAAAKASISQDTATKWMKLPTFRAAYDEAQQQALAEARRYLQQSLMLGVTKLRELMATAHSQNVQLNAARALVEMAIKAWEIEHLKSRVDGVLAAVEELRNARS
jgi:hypothetical protein